MNKRHENYKNGNTETNIPLYDWLINYVYQFVQHVQTMSIEVIQNKKQSEDNRIKAIKDRVIRDIKSLSEIEGEITNT